MDRDDSAQKRKKIDFSELERWSSHDWERWAPDDIVGWSQRVDAHLMRLSYPFGVFPWPSEDAPVVPWFSPRDRALFFTNSFHLSRSLRRTMRSSLFHTSWNLAFTQCVQACRTTHQPQGVWITPDLEHAYQDLFRTGNAASFEVWKGSDLWGGVIMVLGTGVVSAESMFSFQSDGSKVALYELCNTLRDRGHRWFDAQVMNPHLASLGAISVDRMNYYKLLKEARSSAHK